MALNEGIRTFIAGEALYARRRVKIEAGTTSDPPEVVYADAGEAAIGITEYAVADGDRVAVRLTGQSGTAEFSSSGAFSRGAMLYAADDGQVDDTGHGPPVGIAIEAATAADNLVEGIQVDGDFGFYTEPDPALLVTSLTYKGVTRQGVAASAGSYGDIYYMNASGEYALANVSTAATSPGICVLLQDCGAGSTVLFLFKGVVMDSNWTFTPGDIVYLDSGTAGDVSQTAPTTKQPLGWAAHKNKLVFDPDWNVA